MWRWDQGRLQYFQFDVLKKIASVLVKFDGTRISDCESTFRSTLMASTGMPFAPDHYTILRNYKRVFECAFLATVSSGYLIVSDFSRELIKPDGSFNNVDDFLLSYINRFRFPFLAFDGYNNTEQRVYPFCAIIKYLIALYQRGKQAAISLDDIYTMIIANHCTGYESVQFYKDLKPGHYNPTYAETRQLREMVVFISQLSILKVYDGKLWLDIRNPITIDELVSKFLTPIVSTPKSSRLEEFNSITRISGELVLPTIEMYAFDNSDLEFIEGKRRRVEHFRVDRSPLLRKYYREQHQRPICGMCKMDVSLKYPWTEYMLDIHHLLPLSSSVAITLQGTSLQDIVGLCPSCHRSIHIYYSKWLKNNAQDDFYSRAEAKNVYLSAIKEIV